MEGGRKREGVEGEEEGRERRKGGRKGGREGGREGGRDPDLASKHWKPPHYLRHLLAPLRVAVAHR